MKPLYHAITLPPSLAEASPAHAPSLPFPPAESSCGFALPQALGTAFLCSPEPTSSLLVHLGTFSATRTAVKQRSRQQTLVLLRKLACKFQAMSRGATPSMAMYTSRLGLLDVAAQQLTQTTVESGSGTPHPPNARRQHMPSVASRCETGDQGRGRCSRTWEVLQQISSRVRLLLMEMRGLHQLSLQPGSICSSSSGAGPSSG